MTFPIMMHRNLYRTKGVVFDGTNDWMSRGADLTGIADGSKATYAFWIKANNDNAQWAIVNSNKGSTVSRFGVRRLATNVIEVKGRTTVPADVLVVASTQTITNDGRWHHVLISHDLTVPVCQIAIDGVLSGLTTTTLTLNGVIDFTDQCFIGADSAGAARLNGTLGYMWFNTSYLDLSVTANLRKFVDGGGNIVNLGANGELPLGSTPLVFQRVALNGAASDFATNLGSGGNFTITGSLDLAAGPSG